jgi:hypothetical protein
MKLDAKMRRGGFLLKEGKRRDPSWMIYKCHPSREGDPVKVKGLRGTFRV